MLKVVNVTEDYKGFKEIGIPDTEERDRLIGCRDIYVEFIENIAGSYEELDSLEDLAVLLYMDSDYRGTHLLSFYFKAADPSIEVKFTTPKSRTKGYSMAHKLFMEFSSEDILIFKDDSATGHEIEWSLEMWFEDSKLEETIVADVFMRLKDTAANIIRGMECEFWPDYKSQDMHPNYYEHLIFGRDWSSYSYNVFEGVSNFGKRAYIQLGGDEEILIDIPEPAGTGNKVYMAYCGLRYAGPDTDASKIEEKYELEISIEGSFRIDNTTRPGIRKELCIGEITYNQNIVYCEMSLNREDYSDYIVYKDKDAIRFFGTDGDGYRDEFARIEFDKRDNKEVYEYETQLYKQYCIKTYRYLGKEIGLLYILASLIVKD